MKFFSWFSFFAFVRKLIKQRICSKFCVGIFFAIKVYTEMVHSIYFIFKEEIAMVEMIYSINGKINDIVWGPYMVFLLVGVGIFMTIRLNFIQFGKFKYIWKNTIGKRLLPKIPQIGTGKIKFPLSSSSTVCSNACMR